MSATREYQNIYGRRWGRGLRPWLLIFKIVSVAVFIGGLASTLVLAFGGPAPQTPAEWSRLAGMIRLAYTRVIVVGLLGALVFGILLLLPHFRVLIRMRWLQVKLGILAVFIPTFHLFMSARSAALREAVARQDFETAGLLREQLYRGTVAALAIGLVVVVLGRIKPRLGQAYGRTFASGATGADKAETN